MSAHIGERTGTWMVRAWVLALTLLLLGPALAPGFVLSYDMVWVPDLALRPDFLGLGSGLPRAVPSDAVVAVVDEVVPGMLLQKVVLVGSLLTAGLGAARLVADRGLVARGVAGGLAVWNPFVAERLLLGHWTVLVAYAGLPWLVVLGRRAREEGRLPAATLPLLLTGSLSAAAGAMTSLVLLLAAGGRGVGKDARLVAAVLAANAPWLVAGLLHAGAARTDPQGAAAFALNDEGWLPGPLAALVLGGVWNTEVQLPSLAGWAGAVLVLVLGALVVLGWSSWWRATGARDRRVLLGAWGVGWGLAVATWLLPGLVGWAAATVPGAGLVRDGGRWLALCAPLLVALVAHGAAVLAARVRLGPARVAVVVAVLLLPVTLMPDAALGRGGRLAAAEHPAAYAAAADAVRAVDPRGDVLVLPLTSYRAPEWNSGHKVLDPLGRYLPADHVAADDLVVDGTTIPGEDPRVRAAAQALAAPDPAGRAAALADLGIELVVVDAAARGTSPEVAGRRLVEGPVRVTVLDEVEVRADPVVWTTALGLAWSAYVALVGVSLVVGVRRLTRRRPPSGD